MRARALARLLTHSRGETHKNIFLVFLPTYKKLQKASFMFCFAFAFFSIWSKGSAIFSFAFFRVIAVAVVFRSFSSVVWYLLHGSDAGNERIAFRRGKILYLWCLSWLKAFFSTMYDDDTNNIIDIKGEWLRLANGLFHTQQHT